jgi:hypothetical protein
MDGVKMADSKAIDVALAPARGWATFRRGDLVLFGLVGSLWPSWWALYVGASFPLAVDIYLGCMCALATALFVFALIAIPQRVRPRALEICRSIVPLMFGGGLAGIICAATIATVAIIP